MKRFFGFFKGVPRTLRNYWRKLYNKSSNKNMSRGAENIDKIISHHRQDNWRRRDMKKPPKHD